MDKREAQYAQARGDLLHEMLRAGAFDMDESMRGDFVSSTIRQLRTRYPEVSDQLWKQLTGDGMRATYGDATTMESARKGRGTELDDSRA